jgi:hypothetical protein
VTNSDNQEDRGRWNAAAASSARVSPVELRRPDLTTQDLDLVAQHEQLGRATRASLLRWLRRQLRQPEPLRERLKAAIEHDDPALARRIVARFAFSDPQRRHATA